MKIIEKHNKKLVKLVFAWFSIYEPRPSQPIDGKSCKYQFNQFFIVFFNDFHKLIPVYTSLTSLYNGFVDLLVTFCIHTSFYNGFIDSGATIANIDSLRPFPYSIPNKNPLDLELVWPELPKAVSLVNS